MKNKKIKIAAILMTGIMGIAPLTAYSASDPAASLESQSASESDESSQNQEYSFPSMGFTAIFPDTLMDQMNHSSMTMFMNEIFTEDGSALQYGLLTWKIITEELLTAETFDPDEIPSVGALGVYQTAMTDQLNDLTGCDQHQELGQSADGKYVYYLSINTEADPELTEEILAIQTTITEMTPFEAPSSYDSPVSEFTGTSVGEFSTQDIEGNSYTQDIFKDYDLTLVNIFATWCSPCVAEMPDLEQLHQQMADRGVHVVGIILDVLNEKGEIIQNELERAQLLVERTKVTYPILLPDSTYLNGRLIGMDAIPETFFVDKNGNIVGETYSGNRSLEDWISIVEKELSNLEVSQ